MFSTRKDKKAKLPVGHILSTNIESAVIVPYRSSFDHIYHDPLAGLIGEPISITLHTAFLPFTIFGSFIKSTVDIHTRKPLSMLDQKWQSNKLIILSSEGILNLSRKIINSNGKSNSSQLLRQQLSNMLNEYTDQPNIESIGNMRTVIINFMNDPLNAGKKTQISIFNELIKISPELHLFKIAIQLALASRGFKNGDSDTYIGSLPIDVLRIIASMTDETIDTPSKMQYIDKGFNCVKQ